MSSLPSSRMPSDGVAIDASATRSHPADTPDGTRSTDGDAATHATTTALLDLVLRIDSVEERLQDLAATAADLSPAIAACGITVRRSGRLQSIAASDSLALDVDELQYEAQEGPCLDSLASAQLFVIADYLSEPRWPRYGPHAVAHGVRSSMSVPLRAAGTPVGALNVYGAEPHLFVDALHDAVIDFGERAEAVVALALRQAEQSDLVEHLHHAMESRSVIDQALGVLMAQQRCSADEAFGVLRRASQGRNRKVADIAADIVSAVSGGPPRTGHFGR